MITTRQIKAEQPYERAFLSAVCEPIAAADLIGRIKFQNATAVCPLFRCMTLAAATRDAGALLT